MPLYEYRCAKCNRVFEVLQKFSDKPLSKHPDCGGKVEKLISASGFSFKGSGFYITDYRSEKYKEAAKKDSASAASSGGDSKSSKSESKPAATTKSETKPAKTAATKT